MTQTEKVLRYMELFGSITPYDAFNDLAITRLAARISDLANAGVKIKRERESGKNRFGESVSYTRYSLEVGA